MDFPSPLLKGTLVKRYKRFLADVILQDGSEVTAHCANPGSMMGLQDPGMTVWLSPSTNPKRKLKYSWEMVEVGFSPTLVGIHTNITNKLAEEAILSGKIPELAGYTELRREVKYGKNSRIDLLLEDQGKANCYVEVKSVTLMRQPGLAEFPDAKTVRGAKHLAELSDMVAQGHRAVMLYVVQRADASSFDLCRDIDPSYGQAFDAARAAGVEMSCYHCTLSTRSIEVVKAVPFIA